MGKRNDDGSWHDACLTKLKPGEPFFVLRGQDELASALVRTWAWRARMYGLPTDRFDEAMATADAMEAWLPRKMPD